MADVSTRADSQVDDAIVEHRPKSARGRTAADLGRYRNQYTRRPCAYPFEAVVEARKLRKHGFFYREIAESLQQTHGVKVSWITVRDWVKHHYRMRS